MTRPATLWWRLVACAAAISGQLEVLAAQAHPSTAEIRRLQRAVGAEIARTSRLIEDMLLLARSERRDFLRRTSIGGAQPELEIPGFRSDVRSRPSGARSSELSHATH